MSWEKFCDASDVREGEPFVKTVGKREIGVLRHGQELFAVLNVCPHAAAPIVQGKVEAAVVGHAPGESFGRDGEQLVLRCPWHHWEFDLESGESLCPIKPKLKIYPLKVEDGAVWVDV